MKAITCRDVFLIILSSLLLSSYGCKSPNQQIDPRSFTDFRFRKIQMYLDDSARYFKAMDSLYADLPEDRRAFEVFTCKHVYYNAYRHDPATALLYADSILNAVKKLQGQPGYVFWYAGALVNKADDLRALRRYPESFRYYFFATELLRQTGDTCAFAELDERMATLAYQQKAYRVAIRYYNRAFKMREQCGGVMGMYNEHVQFSTQQTTLDNIGLCYGKLGFADSAILYYDSALSYIDHNYQRAFRFVNQQKILDTDYLAMARGVIYGNKAQELMALGNMNEAKDLLMKSIAMNGHRSRALEDVPYSLAKLSDLFLRTDQFNDADKTLLRLQQLLDTVPNVDIAIKLQLLRANLADKRGDAVASKSFLKQYLFIKDSVDRANVELLASDLGTEFDYLQAASHLSAINQNSDSRNIYMIIAAVAVALCLLGGLLLWHNKSQSKKHFGVLAAFNKEMSDKNAKLEATLQELKESENEKGRLMKVIAHDLRNPVGGIEGASGLLLKSENLTERQRHILQIIHKSSSYATAMIQELMQQNTIQGESRITSLELSELVRDCVDILKIPALNKEQQLVLNATNAQVNGDKEKLWRVFSNLIGNAIKFSPQGKAISIDFTVDKETVVVAVKDEGIGVPDNLKAKIFSSEREGSRPGTNGEVSFGLGLGICKQIVEGHNGRLWAEDNGRVGTAFFVSLPLAV